MSGNEPWHGVYSTWVSLVHMGHVELPPREVGIAKTQDCHPGSRKAKRYMCRTRRCFEKGGTENDVKKIRLIVRQSIYLYL